MSFAAPLPKENKPRGRLRLPGRFTWPLAFLALAVAAFIFYYLLTLGYLDPSVRDFAQKWMPIGSINEALVWVMAALGLNIVVGYAGLLDLGFGEIIPQIFHNGDNVGGVNLSNGTKGISPIDPVQGLVINQQGVGFRSMGPFDHLSRYIIFVLLTAVIIFMSLRLREGRLGRAWLAIREDELAASAMGVPLMRTKLAAYAVGAVAGGVAGVAFATHVSGVLPDRFQFSISITLLAMVVLGGMGNVWGVLLGALVLAWFNSTGLPQFGDSFNSTFNTKIDFTSYTFVIFGATLVLMMLFRREGLLPESRTRLVLREPERTDVEALGSDMEEQAPELDAIAAGGPDEGGRP